jgi:hypothetical protein
LFGFENEIRRIKSQRLSKSEKRYQLRVINTDISNFYHDLIQFHRPELWKSRDEIKNNPQFYGLLGYLRTVFIPPGMNFNEIRDFHYHITQKRNLKLYIARMFLLCRQLENYNDQLNPEDYKIPLFNVCPLRRSCIPKYITIDTQTLFNLFLGKEPPNRDQINDVKNGWKQIFNIDLRCFTSKEIRPDRTERLKIGFGYTFNYLIKTDGISCSISLVKTDINGKPVTTNDDIDNEDDDDDEVDDQDPNDVPYITEPMFDRFNDITRVVVIDPGKIDLINAARIGYVLDYAAIRQIKKIDPFYDPSLDPNPPVKLGMTYFKYTNTERKHHTGTLRYNKQRTNLRQLKIGGKTIGEIESELSDENSKTVDFNRFQNYITMKLQINRLVNEHYFKGTNYMYSKLRWYKYINTQRHESRMLKSFAEKMGGPKEVVIVIGDYSESTMKGQEPTITKRLRKLFKDSGYNVFLIDEFNTSKLCNNCGEEMKNLVLDANGRKLDKYIPATKAGEEANGKEIWKLMRCQSCESAHKALLHKPRTQCISIYNRDHNACKNMLLIVYTRMCGMDRPEPWRRQENDNQQHQPSTTNGRRPKTSSTVNYCNIYRLILRELERNNQGITYFI